MPAHNGWNQTGTSSTISDAGNHRNPEPFHNGWNRTGFSSTVSDCGYNRNPVPEGHVSPDTEDQSVCSIASTKSYRKIREETSDSEESNSEDKNYDKEDEEQHGSDPLLDDVSTRLVMFLLLKEKTYLLIGSSL